MHLKNSSYILPFLLVLSLAKHCIFLFVVEAPVSRQPISFTCRFSVIAVLPWMFSKGPSPPHLTHEWLQCTVESCCPSLCLYPCAAGTGLFQSMGITTLVGMSGQGSYWLGALDLQSFLWDWLRLLKSISCIFTAAFTYIFQIKAAVGRFIIAVFQTLTRGNKLNVEDKMY